MTAVRGVATAISAFLADAWRLGVPRPPPVLLEDTPLEVREFEGTLGVIVDAVTASNVRGREGFWAVAAVVGDDRGGDEGEVVTPPADRRYSEKALAGAGNWRVFCRELGVLPSPGWGEVVLVWSDSS